MKISDIKGFCNKRELEFISARNVNKDYWVISLKPQGEMKWNAGEHGIFTIPGKKIKGRGWRVFSLASIPEEGKVIIGTRTGETVSGFKKTLLEMKTGEKVNLRGPFGWYKLRTDERQIVMVATGVGITPDRALLHELVKHPEVNAELVHSGEYHLFREELEKTASDMKRLKLHYTGDRRETALAVDRIATKYGNSAKYYVSGSMKAIKSIKKNLKKAGIKSRNMINDPFLGY